jgi:hypothetical protein
MKGASFAFTISKFACGIVASNPHAVVELSLSFVHTICAPPDRAQRSLSSTPPFVQSPQLHDSPISHVLLLLHVRAPQDCPADLQAFSELHQYCHWAQPEATQISDGLSSSLQQLTSRMAARLGFISHTEPFQREPLRV